MSTAERSYDPRDRWHGYGPGYGWRSWHPGFIVLMILGFIFWWPLGLAISRLHDLEQRHGLLWHDRDRWQRKMARMEEKMGRMREQMSACGGWGPPSSGNHAFDEYRAETLRRLEEEQREFRDFLERLRFAKDKAEFDQFMADRRNRPRRRSRRNLRKADSPAALRFPGRPSPCGMGGPMRFRSFRQRARSATCNEVRGNERNRGRR